MGTEPFERKLAAILYADVAGYSRLTGEDEGATHRRLSDSLDPIQNDLKARNEKLPDERKGQFRIGVNLGDVIEDRDDIYGDSANVAARLEGLAVVLAG